MSDITARKRVEAELQQVHDELEHRVTERTEALRRANEELRTDIINRKRAEKEIVETLQPVAGNKRHADSVRKTCGRRTLGRRRRP